jgi:Xaa-Pro aminopeptidase
MEAREVRMQVPADVTWSGYSVAERDRRWGVVRRQASPAGLDCIFVPFGNREDARYLSQVPDAVVVLPTDGRPAAMLNDRGVPNEWIAEARAANRSWGAAMAELLRELGMERARIGVSGLQNGKVTHVRAFDGVLNYSAYATVLQQLPNATFVEATDVVGLARFVKSEEEIACARRASQIAAAGIDRMIELARPGVDEAYLYGQVSARLMELGSENYHWAMKAGTLEREGPRFTNPPIGRRLKARSYITTEVDAVWGGIVTQEVQPILLGTIPEAWRPVIDLQAALFHAGLDHIRPGVAFGDLIDWASGFGKERGGATRILMSGRGYGDDGPLLTPRAAGEGVRDLTVQCGNVFVWKPYGMSADGQRSYSWGGAVVVTNAGTEMLVQREPGLVSIPS